jgi:hypothetical protein
MAWERNKNKTYAFLCCTHCANYKIKLCVPFFFSQQRCAFEKRFLQTHFHGNLVRNASSSSSIHATQNPEINADPSMP